MMESRKPPTWSVMIPTFNPKADLLARTIQSILAQDPGPEEMQIEILDDGSTEKSALGQIQSLAPGRIGFHQESRNLGLSGIWNRCVDRARGKWVHILHQDDWVLPGFFLRLSGALESPDEPGLAFCRYSYCSQQGTVLGVSDEEAPVAGILPNALEKFVLRQRIQTPAVVVRKEAYERLGGFRDDLCFTLDWEMWCRIASAYPVWYEPSPLACYRMHDLAETFRLRKQGKDILDMKKCISITSRYLPLRQRRQASGKARQTYALEALDFSKAFFLKGEINSALLQMRGALLCSQSIPVLLRTARLILQFMKNFQWKRYSIQGSRAV